MLTAIRQRIRRLCAAFRELLRQHDQGVAQADLRMAEASVRHQEPEGLRRPERLPVELQCLRRPLMVR